MDEIVNFLKNNYSIILIGCIPIIVIIIIVKIIRSDFFENLLDRWIMGDYVEDDIFSDREPEFSKTLLEAIELDTVRDLEDVIQIYKGVFNLDSENLSHKRELSNLLRKFLLKMIKNDFHDRVRYSLNSNYEDEKKKSLNINVVEWKSNILDFIRKNDELAPYSNLPENERTILIDLNAFAEKGDHDAILRKVNELANMLKGKNVHLKENDKYVEKLEKMNRWSVPMAAIGLVLTIFFGVISIL